MPDAAAQFRGAALELSDGAIRSAELAGRRAGFWVPMGGETSGPAFGTYDDFFTLTVDGRAGASLFEQGILHRVF
jgi:hypothetical protein